MACNNLFQRVLLTAPLLENKYSMSMILHVSDKYFDVKKTKTYLCDFLANILGPMPYIIRMENFWKLLYKL